MQNAERKAQNELQIPIYRTVSVGEGLDPPFDFAVQNQIAVRQFIVISFGNPENANIFGREGAAERSESSNLNACRGQAYRN